MRVPRLQAPARAQLTGNFQLVALGFRGGALEGVVGRGGLQVVPGVVGDGPVAFLDLEVRQAGVQAAIEKFALEADFIVFALVRVNQLAVAVQVVELLRHKHIGVAGIRGQVVSQVIGDASIGNQAPRLTIGIGGAGERVVDHPAAQKHFQVIGDIQAGRGVHAGLAHGVVVDL